MLDRARGSPSPFAAFVAGAGFAVVTSGSILQERASSGSPTVALAANLFVSLAAIVLLGLLERRAAPTKTVVLPQAVGAVGGIVLVHLALRIGVLPAPPWLSERPAQWVNDLVAVFATLAVVWACARRLDLRLLVGALAVIAAYRGTAHLWHLDVAPRGFTLRVQDLVIAQFVAAALSLPIYRGMTRHAA